MLSDEVKTPDLDHSPGWRNSILGKVAFFLLLAVAFAYVSGAATGWLMIERAQKADWARQASTNAQISSSAIRGVYTFVTVDMTPAGQITGIVSDRMIGDDQSVLDTGFVPLDVLSLASLQTKEPVWLLRYDEERRQLLTLTDSEGGGENLPLVFSDEKGNAHPPDKYATGFASIGSTRHYIALLPITTPDGKLLGAIAASAGNADRLMRMQTAFYRNSLVYGSIIMLATGIAIMLVMRRLFHPIPALIEALKRIARDETGRTTPFRQRRDEIGQLANAIETLREGVVEREHLRQVREAARELEHLAHHDPLTGLPNRAFLQKTLSRMLEEVELFGRTINVMLLDLDRFKPVNDTYGHAVGDQLLIATCHRLSVLLGPQDVLARLGGDEFALIQAVSVNARTDAARLGERIIDAMNRPFQINDLSIGIGISIGVATAPLHGRTLKDIMSHADVALYTSKGAGRGCLRHYQPGMTMESSGRSAIEQELMLALGEDQFEIFYQPIIAIQDGRLCGHEALVRWRHPVRGLLTPDQFIEAAEESGLIVELDRWVLSNACRTFAAMPNAGTLAVNISAADLLRSDLPDFLRATLDATGLAPHRLEIEVTETSPIAEREAVTALHAIRGMGIGVAIDDFGTGFSSLSYLLDLPLTRIKFDRRFVAGLVDNPRALNILRALMMLANGLGIEATAEGIENRQQLHILRGLGCKSAQGYLFGKPQAEPLQEDDAEGPGRFRAIV
ncbi:EAL domain-containing protein [Allorhizobium undicola]|uniref:EAL domain-containing protein n=1 Tax=Allorhizobium undicola TaxID=78527 RepID=UPI003D331510